MIESDLLVDCYELSDKKQLSVLIRESNTSGMRGYHMHSHYEISFILQGNVSVMVGDQIQSGTMPRIVFLPPYSSHQMILEPGSLYRHMNISFTEEYISRFLDEWQNIFGIFGRKGAIYLPNEEQCLRIEQSIRMLARDADAPYCRYLLIYFISFL